MKSFRTLSTIAFAIALSSASMAQEALKIATVDVQELFKQYHRTAEEQSKLNVDRARIQKENNERLERIREADTKLKELRKQLDDSTVGESKKQALYKEFQALNQDAIALDRERKEFVQRRSQALNEKMGQQMKSILDEVRKLIDEKAKADGFTLVFDKSVQNAAPAVLYAKDSLDITPAILKELNKNAPADFDPKKATQEAVNEAPAPEKPAK